MPSLRQQLNALIDKLSPDMEKAFQAAISEIKSEVVLKEVVAYLERRDIEGTIQALHIEQAAFRPLYEQVRTSFSAGGALVMQNMPTITDNAGARVVVRWDVSNQGAEANIRQLAGNLITNVSAATVEGVRSHIVAGYSAGQGPDTIARGLIGRQSKTTGKREGGVIGLSSPQAETVERARINLMSGDPKLMRRYFDLSTRDKRYDKAVQRAIAAGKPLDAETLQKVLMRLRAGALKVRGNAIARTETLMAVTNAKHEAYRQALAKSGRNETLVTRTWRSAGDGRVRHTHMALNAQEVTGMDLPFVSPSGAMMRYPGDTSMGAGPAEVINCFAPWTRISPAGLVAAVAHEYSGDLIELSVGGDIYLSVTPNHPILTHRGWVPAGHVMEGDKLINRTVTDLVGSAKPEIGNADPRADELYDAAKAMGGSVRAGRGIVNFHGHVPRHDVDVVTLPSELRDALKPALRKAFGDITLAETDISMGRLVYERIVNARSFGHSFTSNAIVSLGRSLSSLLSRHEGSAAGDAFRNAWEFVTKVLKAGVHDTARPAYGAGNRENGMAFIVKVLYAIKVFPTTFSMASRGHLALDAGNFVLTSGGKAEIAHAASNNTVRDAKGSGDTVNGHALGVESFDSVKILGSALPPYLNRTKWSLSSVAVSHVRRVSYSGLVYDFQTENGLIIAENNVAHNCRCDIDYRFDFTEAYARSRGR